MNIKWKRLILTAAMPVAMAVMAPAQAIPFVIDDFNTTDPITVTDTTVGGVEQVNAPVGANNTVMGVLGGAAGWSRDIAADLLAVDQMETEICNNCLAGHLVSGAGGSTGNSSFIYQGSSIDVNAATVTGVDGVMFTYAADLDGGVVQFTFDRTGFTDVVVSSAALLNTSNSSDISNGVNVTLDLPNGLSIFDDLESVRIDILGVADLDFTIDDAKLTMVPVPEPSLLVLLSAGLLGLGWQRRRRRAG